MTTPLDLDDPDAMDQVYDGLAQYIATIIKSPDVLKRNPSLRLERSSSISTLSIVGGQHEEMRYEFSLPKADSALETRVYISHFPQPLFDSEQDPEMRYHAVEIGAGKQREYHKALKKKILDLKVIPTFEGNGEFMIAYSKTTATKETIEQLILDVLSN